MKMKRLYKFDQFSLNEANHRGEEEEYEGPNREGRPSSNPISNEVKKFIDVYRRYGMDKIVDVRVRSSTAYSEFDQEEFDSKWILENPSRTRKPKITPDYLVSLIKSVENTNDGDDYSIVMSIDDLADDDDYGVASDFTMYSTKWNKEEKEFILSNL
jgi:hypothetical protein